MPALLHLLFSPQTVGVSGLFVKTLTLILKFAKIIDEQDRESFESMWAAVENGLRRIFD